MDPIRPNVEHKPCRDIRNSVGNISVVYMYIIALNILTDNLLNMVSMNNNQPIPVIEHNHEIILKFTRVSTIGKYHWVFSPVYT